MLCFFQCLGFFSIICWQTLTMALIQYPDVTGIWCPGAPLDILWPLLLPCYFFPFKTLYKKPCVHILHLPASQMAPFPNYPVSFSREAHISPAMARCTEADQSCHGGAGSYRASQSSLQSTGDPDEIIKSQEEPTSTVKSHLESPFHTQLGA